MRHGKKFNHLSRKAGHRKAMLGNMASSLILHKRINTTVAKAKALRKYVEPLITKSKSDSTHSRRIVFKNLQDKFAVSELFNEVAPKISNRDGGYTRIIKTGNRLGDNAEMCLIELVDFNELLLADNKPKKKRTRRSKKSDDAVDAPAAEKKEEAKADDKKETKKEDAPKAEAKKTEAKEEKKEAPKKDEDSKKED